MEEKNNLLADLKAKMALLNAEILPIKREITSLEREVNELEKEIWEQEVSRFKYKIEVPYLILDRDNEEVVEEAIVYHNWENFPVVIDRTDNDIRDIIDILERERLVLVEIPGRITS